MSMYQTLRHPKRMHRRLKLQGPDPSGRPWRWYQAYMTRQGRQLPTEPNTCAYYKGVLVGAVWAVKQWYAWRGVVPVPGCPGRLPLSAVTILMVVIGVPAAGFMFWPLQTAIMVGTVLYASGLSGWGLSILDPHTRPESYGPDTTDAFALWWKRHHRLQQCGYVVFLPACLIGLMVVAGFWIVSVIIDRKQAICQPIPLPVAASEQ